MIPGILLTQTCQISPYVGTSPKGPKYGTTYSSKCRYESYKKKFKDDKGKEFISNGKLFLPATDDNWGLTRDSLITVDGETYRIFIVALQRGFSRSHVECVVM